MARFVIILALAAIMFNTGSLHIIGLSLTSNAMSVQDKENPHDTLSQIPAAITGFQSMFLNIFQNHSIVEYPLQVTGECVVKCKKTARVVRSS
jgi:hypothetical protein